MAAASSLNPMRSQFVPHLDRLLRQQAAREAVACPQPGREPCRAALEDYLANLAQLIERTAAIRLETLRPEETELLDVLTTAVARAVFDAREALEQLRRALQLAAPLDFPEAMGALDVVTLAQGEVDRALKDLQACPARVSAWDVYLLAASAQTVVLRCLTAAEAGLGACLGVAAPARREEETALAVRIRAAYAQLRAVVGTSEPEPGQVLRRLRCAAGELESFCGGELFGRLRVTDRIQFNRLRDEIGAALRGDTVTTARQLAAWRGLVAFLGVLQQINQRTELVTHDRELARAMLARLDEARFVLGSFDAAEMAMLAQLRGRDAAIDRLLVEGDGRVTAWREHLEALASAGAAGCEDWGE